MKGLSDMKKSLTTVFALTFAFSLTACSSATNDVANASSAITSSTAITDTSTEENVEGKHDNVTVKLGIMGASDETIWNPIVADFAEKGVTIEYVFFTDYTQPNAALNAGDIDLNAFQHYTYLNSEKEKFGYEIDAIGDTLITALNVYSRKVSSIDEIPEGGKDCHPK